MGGHLRGGPKARRCSPFTTQTTTAARLCWLCPNQAGDLRCLLGGGTFPGAASAAGAVSPPAPLMRMGRPVHPHPGDGQGHRQSRALGTSSSTCMVPHCCRPQLTPLQTLPSAPLLHQPFPEPGPGLGEGRAPLPETPKLITAVAVALQKSRAATQTPPPKVTRLLQPGCLAGSGAINHPDCRRRGSARVGDSAVEVARSYKSL